MSELIFSRVQKLPKYVFAMVNELKMKLRREGEDIVDLGMGNPDLPPAPHIIEKLCEVARAYQGSERLYATFTKETMAWS
jgi:alanine-synthesizing transaminase